MLAKGGAALFSIALLSGFKRTPGNLPWPSGQTQPTPAAGSPKSSTGPIETESAPITGYARTIWWTKFRYSYDVQQLVQSMHLLGNERMGLPRNEQAVLKKGLESTTPPEGFFVARHTDNSKRDVTKCSLASGHLVLIYTQSLNNGDMTTTNRLDVLRVDLGATRNSTGVSTLAVVVDGAVHGINQAGVPLSNAPGLAPAVSCPPGTYPAEVCEVMDWSCLGTHCAEGAACGTLCALPVPGARAMCPACLEAYCAYFYEHCCEERTVICMLPTI